MRLLLLLAPLLLLRRTSGRYDGPRSATTPKPSDTARIAAALEGIADALEADRTEGHDRRHTRASLLRALGPG